MPENTGQIQKNGRFIKDYPSFYWVLLPYAPCFVYSESTFEYFRSPLKNYDKEGDKVGDGLVTPKSAAMTSSLEKYCMHAYDMFTYE